MPPRRSQGDSKQGLVITLVICFLFIIGLGVAAYYGFADQAAKEAAAKKAKDEADTFKAERDWYKFQAWLYCKYMGHDQNIDTGELANSKAQFDRLAKGQKDAEAVKAVVDKLTNSKDLGWDTGANKPKSSYEDVLAKSRNDYDALEKKSQALQQSETALTKKVKELDDQLQQARKDYDAELVKANEKAKTDLSDDRKKIDDLRNEISRLAADRETLVKAQDDAKAKLEKAARVDKKQIAELKNTVAERTQELLALKAKVSEVPSTLRTDWQIVRMDTRGTMPYINLGSADRVKPQLTFSIHGMGLDGRPSSPSKGTLEVVNVLGDHLSQARITSVKDPNRDPIVVGDVLFNPFWNPLLKKHVALTGLYDLSTSGQRDAETGIRDFMRHLERNNVIVDAWLDPKDYTIKGPGITSQTDYLIQGELIDFFGPTGERNVELNKKLEKANNEMKRQAVDNGVQMVNLRNYLEMIGYRLPPNLEEPTGVSPLFKGRPELVPPRPVEKQPLDKEKADSKNGR
jgi:hypothetical protein